MKKIFAIIMAILMIMCMMACGGSVDSPNSEISSSNTAKTATFEINNIELWKDSAPTYIYAGTYCESLDKTLLIEGRLREKFYEEFYCKFSEGDYVKVTWEEDEKGEVIQSSLIFEKVSGELVPIKDKGEP